MFSRISDYFSEMSPRQLLVLAGVAIIMLFGLFYWGFGFLYESVNEEMARKQAAQDELLQQVIVAKQDIPARTYVQEDMLTTVKMPVSEIPKGAIIGLQNIVGKPVQSDVRAGDVLTGNKLYDDTRQAGFIGLIPANCRAVTVSISKLTSTAGFAKPGDKVDVVLIPNQSDGVHQVNAEILLQNVTLLAINEILDTGERSNSKKTDEKGVTKVDDKPIDNPASATLALEPNDAMTLLMASRTGTIYLVLRPTKPSNPYLEETEYGYSTNASMAAAQTSSEEQAAPPAPANASRPAPAFKPPASPVTGNAGAAGAVSASAPSGSFEIIPWGGQ